MIIPTDSFRLCSKDFQFLLAPRILGCLFAFISTKKKSQGENVTKDETVYFQQEKKWRRQGKERCYAKPMMSLFFMSNESNQRLKYTLNMSTVCLFVTT